VQITIDKLTKIYKGGIVALDDVNLEISHGMFGLLGPNGAGKSTLMKILATLEMPTSGDVHFDGMDLRGSRRRIRQSLGYLPQTFGVYPQLTGVEFLSYMASLHGFSGSRLRQRVEQTLKEVSLFEFRDRKAKAYSGGMMRRLGIGQALISDPELLIVDEPTVGLDPEERIRFRNLLAEISQNKVIILSTHIVGDISSTCNDLALLAKGRVVYRGLPQELISRCAGKVWQIECGETDFKNVAEHLQIISSVSKDRRLVLRALGDGDRRADLQMTAVTPNLEDSYMYFMETIAGQKVTDDNEEAALSN
jgi:ABC-type multidrug transport system ATPase subunit